jgi:hypothetical protein
MAKKRKTITLTEEHIALISNVKFEKFVFDDKEHYSQFKSLVNNLELSNDKNYQELNKTVLEELHDFDPHSRFGWGCDQWNLFGGTYVLEDIAMILGYFDQAIENSETLATGRRFPDELEEKMYNLYEYICDNLEDILVLAFTFLGNGGLVPGTYEYVDFRWKRKENK